MNEQNELSGFGQCYILSRERKFREWLSKWRSFSRMIVVITYYASSTLR